MKVLKETFGEKSVYDWLAEELKAYHKRKYGEDCIVIDTTTGKEYVPSDRVKSQKGKDNQ
jgi:hypothetical protein